MQMRLRRMRGVWEERRDECSSPDKGVCTLLSKGRKERETRGNGRDGEMIGA